jgi:hypothetical protein
MAYVKLAPNDSCPGPRALDVFAASLWLLHNMSCQDLNKGIQDRVPFLASAGEGDEMEISEGELEALRNVTEGMYNVMHGAGGGKESSVKEYEDLFRLHLLHDSVRDDSRSG